MAAEYDPGFAGHDPSDYIKMTKDASKERDTRLNDPNRFQPISKRADRSDWPAEVEPLKCRGRYISLYRGSEAMKSPEDFVTYHQLFYNTRPATVIELGTYVGGMAIWIADQLKLLDIQADVYSMDLDTSQLSDQVKMLKPHNVSYLQGDCHAIGKTFTPDFLSTLSHPLIIIDDAHVNIGGVLRHFHDFLQVGDYFVVEDTNPNISKELGMGLVTSDKDFKKLGRKNLDCLRDFLKEFEEFYSVDSFYTDLFGYNGSWHWHGYIRRMK